MIQTLVVLLLSLLCSVNETGAEAKTVKRKPAQVPSQNETETESVSDLTAAVKAKPTDLKLRYQLAKALVKENKIDEALIHLKVANEKPEPDVLKLLARCYMKKKDDLQVIRALEILLEIKPNDFNARTELADAYYRTRKYDNAIENYRRALKVYPKHRAAYEGLINVYTDRKNNYESRVVLSDLLKYFPNDPKALTELCRLFAVDSFFENAMNYCRLAIKAAPNVADNHVYLGLTLKGSEELKQAQSALFGAANRFPDSEFAQFSAGEMSDQMKSWEASVRYYKKAVAADAKSGRSWIGLSLAHFNAENYQEALDAFLKACQYDRRGYSELTKSTGLLRTKGQEKWYTEYRRAQDRCSMIKP